MLGGFEGTGGERGPDFGEVEAHASRLIDGGGDLPGAFPAEHRLPALVGKAEAVGQLAGG